MKVANRLFIPNDSTVRIEYKASLPDPDPIGAILAAGGRVSVVQYLDAIGIFRSRLNGELKKFLAGEHETPLQMMFAVFEHLGQGHLTMVCAGRKRAGITHSVQEADREVAIFHMQQQGAFLSGFLRDLEDQIPSLYDEEEGEWRVGAINRRLQMYASRLRGTANIAFEANSPDDAEFNWILGAAEHCEDCVELAGQNPWLKGELSVFPGDGGTVCLVNCKCTLLRSTDSWPGFSPDPGVGSGYSEDQ